jgi:lysozyme family protein
MKENLLPSMVALMKHEGGFVNHPRDPGGMTNLGVTQRVWEEWVGHPVSEKEMRALTPAIVAPMYKKKYWDKVSGDLLPSGVDLAVFDFAVNSGPGRAAKMLQRVLGVTEDGAIGPQTLAKAVSIDSSKLIADYNAARLAFLQALPTWADFGNGWGTRVATVKTEATKMTA